MEEKRKRNRRAVCGNESLDVDHLNGSHICKNCKRIFQPMSYEQVLRDNFLSEWQKYFEVTKDTIKVKGNQDAKADSGKPNLSLVPKQIIYEIEKVRSFGVKKYKDPDNWKKVEIKRYHEALLRHTLSVCEDINARDKESGLLHLSHIATNVAFILELMNEKE